PAWLNRASDGHNRRSTPMPGAATRISLSAASGQPPPGKALSSSACPVGCEEAECPVPWPRQIRRESSRRSMATTEDIDGSLAWVLYGYTVSDCGFYTVKPNVTKRLSSAEGRISHSGCAVFS